MQTHHSTQSLGALVLAWDFLVLWGNYPSFPDSSLTLEIVRARIWHWPSRKSHMDEQSKSLKEEGKEISHSRSWHCRCHSHLRSSCSWRGFLGTSYCLPHVPAQSVHHLIPTPSTYRLRSWLVLTLELPLQAFLKVPMPFVSPAAFLEFQNSKPSKPASSSTSKFPLGISVFPTSSMSWETGPLLLWCHLWPVSCHLP